MSAKNFFIVCCILAGSSLLHTACTKEYFEPSDPADIDSTWTEPTDSIDCGGDTTIIDFEDDCPFGDSTEIDGDSLYFGG